MASSWRRSARVMVEVDLGLRFAGLSVATIPILILYFLFSSQIMKGIAAGAVK